MYNTTYSHIKCDAQWKNAQFEEVQNPHQQVHLELCEQVVDHKMVADDQEDRLIYAHPNPQD